MNNTNSNTENDEETGRDSPHQEDSVIETTNGMETEQREEMEEQSSLVPSTIHSITSAHFSNLLHHLQRSDGMTCRPFHPVILSTATSAISIGMNTHYQQQMGIQYPHESPRKHSPVPVETPTAKEQVEMRNINQFLVQEVLRVLGKVPPQELINKTNSSPDFTLYVNEYGIPLDFTVAWYMFVIVNKETDEYYLWVREMCLLTLELYLPTSMVNHLKSLPIGMRIPDYLHLPPTSPVRHTYTPGPCPIGTSFQRRFEEYIRKGFDNLLNRIVKGVPVEMGTNVYDEAYDEE